MTQRDKNAAFPIPGAQLREHKRIEVADFARFLLARQGDEWWEQIIADPNSRRKLDDALEQAVNRIAKLPHIGDRSLGSPVRIGEPATSH